MGALLSLLGIGAWTTILWLIGCVITAPGPTYTFYGAWPTGMMMPNCSENHTADGRCTSFQTVFPALSPANCNLKAAYSNSLPGLGFNGQAVCVPNQ